MAGTEPTISDLNERILAYEYRIVQTKMDRLLFLHDGKTQQVSEIDNIVRRLDSSIKVLLREVDRLQGKAVDLQSCNVQTEIGNLEKSLR